jgi:hypothetical protein
MNTGFFDFPKQNITTDIREFDTSGSYTIPPWATKIFIRAIGGGGGGGGGRKRAVADSGSTFGGGGGSGGSIIQHEFFVETLGGSGTTLEIAIGAGGTGGSGQTTAGTNGSGGNSAGNTQIKVAGKIGILAVAYGGAGGGGGTTATGAAGSVRQSLIHGIQIGNISPATGSTTAPTNVTWQGLNSNGGGGGGGHNAAGGELTSYNGSPIVTPTTATTSVIDPYIERNVTVLSGSGANGESATDYYYKLCGIYSPGLPGAGGRNGATTGTAGNGGNGYRGAGGGGGGGAWSNQTSGTGGTGGNGYCVIMAYA